MTSSIFTLLITIVLSLCQAWAVHPNIYARAPVSNATCQPEYAWMNNAEQQSPCLAVAYVIAACVGDTWTQPALPSGYSYDSPNGTTATPCYCSWSCYNLMMACTLCQNPAYTSDIKTWPSFSENCPSSYTEEKFPNGYVLENDASIPYWATIDPTSWPSELFDIGQAQTYANQNHSDYWPSYSASSSSGSGSKTNLGAIVGGTVGGAAGLLLILVGGYLLYKRRQYRCLRNSNDASSTLCMDTPMTSLHARWPSDPSTVFQSTLPGATMPSQGMGPGLPMLSHSYFQNTSPPLPTETSSFFTTGNTVVQRTRAIPMV
ncbi:hypothetical protein V8E55_001168 [Tylopilus felleus]